MQIAVASGKGGTGKTTFAVNLAHALSKSPAVERDVSLIDCDVEAPNCNLFLNRDSAVTIPVMEPKPVLDSDLCDGCGKCVDVCKSNALAVVNDTLLIFPELCHSCGACSYSCPQNALIEKDTAIGTIHSTDICDGIDFSYGELSIGESLAPKVVTAVKEYAESESIVIIDASPGTSCPVVAALDGADVAILVTEPTPFGLNDLKLAVNLTLKVGLPAGIVINRSNGDNSIITDYAEEFDIPVLGVIPFKREYAEAYSRGEILVDQFTELRQTFSNIYDEVTSLHKKAPVKKGVEETYPLECSAPISDTVQSEFTAVTVISGKGGTGKTTLTASLSKLAESVVFADCDVDAANMHLLLNSEVKREYLFHGGSKSYISPEECNGCGMCIEHCHFGAIKERGYVFAVNPLLCEGCGLCTLVCPNNAVSEINNPSGMWFHSQGEQGSFVHARLGIGEENSGKLVTAVRIDAEQIASLEKSKAVLTDGPPGTACPVIASVTGVDIAVVVTEPTVSGVHDLTRVLDLSKHFGVKPLIVINKSDLNDHMTQMIHQLADSRKIDVIGEIPFDESVSKVLIQGKTAVEIEDSPVSDAIKSIWNELKGYVYA